MFAPLIVKPQAKTAVRPSDKALTRGTTDHDREIEREQTSECTRQIGPRFPNKESAVAWDFSKIPLHPQGRRMGRTGYRLLLRRISLVQFRASSKSVR
jgi:hypothetical protein